MVKSCCHGNVKSSGCGLKLYYIRGNNGSCKKMFDYDNMPAILPPTNSYKLTKTIYKCRVFVVEVFQFRDRTQEVKFLSLNSSNFCFACRVCT
jgi:hypothetical protein